MTSIAIYDPRRLKEEDFLAGFIARDDLVDFLLAQLRLTAVDGEARHRLFLGQRGMGKTSLLRRLEIGTRTDPDLAAALLPLTFREEQYNIRSLDRFWRNCGEALAEWLEASGDVASAERLDSEMCSAAWDEPDGAAEAFLARAAETGRRPVLLLDNLDLILDALPPEQHWQLRRILQAQGGPIVYGAAAQAPRQSGDPQAAFYEFFKLSLLEPLTAAELMRCLQRLAEARGDAGKPVVEVLVRSPERLQVLHRLTGGNPRILALLYQLLERAESDTVFSDLEGLLDQMTQLYKARVEELRTELQRSMLDAIALHWDPITSHDLAETTRVEITTVSSQLAKLKQIGLIEEVPTSGARAGYQLIERFFNVWYLMRHGTRRTRQKMRWLTEFLRSFYSQDDLLELRDRLLRQMPSGEWGELYTEALDAALAGRPAAPATWKEALVAAFSQLERLAHEHLAVLTQVERLAREQIARDPKEAVYWALLGSILMLDPRRAVDAEKAFREATTLDPLLVVGWHGLSFILSQRFDRYSEAAAALRRALILDPTSARTWVYLGYILADHLRSPEEAEEAYCRAKSLDPKRTLDINASLVWLHLSVGRIDEARELRGDISDISREHLSLIDAGFELANDNFGTAATLLADALDSNAGAAGFSRSLELLRLLRLFERHGYGERLIDWFGASHHADRFAPVYSAFVAYIHGANHLLDVNPEVRDAATGIYNWLASDRAIAEPSAPPKPRRRGRAAKRAGR